MNDSGVHLQDTRRRRGLTEGKWPATQIPVACGLDFIEASYGKRTTTDPSEVTCGNCRRIVRENHDE